MRTYKDFKHVVWRALPLGHVISLPIPIMRNDALVDVVFSYVNDSTTLIPSKPLLIIETDLEKAEAHYSEAEGAFPDITYEPAPYEAVESYKEKTAEAKSLYAEIREEAVRGEVGPASQHYAELVWSVTQKPLRPYYRALSPALFANCQ
ncbi:MAG: hypothetical protein Q4B45_04090 [Coriobacteriia bacterium]|nr:hypothetical protein [Coriobacteriia bacterium]